MFLSLAIISHCLVLVLCFLIWASLAKYLYSSSEFMNVMVNYDQVPLSMHDFDCLTSVCLLPDDFGYSNDLPHTLDSESGHDRIRPVMMRRWMSSSFVMFVYNLSLTQSSFLL
mgnify:CR=1 FL=1